MFRRYADTNTPGGVQVIKSKKDLGTDHSRHITARSIAEYGVEPRPGFLLTRVRAISSRVNQNFDGFPSEELKKAYKSFVGRPVFVNHSNHDPSRARGRVVASQYFEDGNDKYIELVMEVDAKNYPKLAAEIEAGRIDSVSMGCDVQESICSYCGNVAKTGADFCDHILHSKGQLLPRESSDGEYESVLVYEECRGLNFFEISYVFDPADETAVMSEVIRTSSLKKAASKKTGYGEVVAPAPVDTLREESVCPQCGDDSFDEVECLFCGYTAPPKMLQDPDVDRAKREDFRVVREEQNPTRQTSRKEDTEMAKSLQEAVRRRRVSEAGSRLRRLQAGDLSQPEENIAQTPAPQAAPVTTEEVRNEEDTTNVEDLDDTVSENPEADEKADVTKLERRRQAGYGELMDSGVCPNCHSYNIETGWDDVDPSEDVKCNDCGERFSVDEANQAGTRTSRRQKRAEYGDWDTEWEDQMIADPRYPAVVRDVRNGDWDSAKSLANEYGVEVNDVIGLVDADTNTYSSKRKRASDPDLSEGGPGGQDGEGAETGSNMEAAEPDATTDVEVPIETSDEEAESSQYNKEDWDEANGTGPSDEGVSTELNFNSRRRRRTRQGSRRTANWDVLMEFLETELAEELRDVKLSPDGEYIDGVVVTSFTLKGRHYQPGDPISLRVDEIRESLGLTSSRGRTSSIQAMRLTDLYIQAGLLKNADKYTKMAEFEKLPAAIVDDRIALLQLVSKNMQTRTASAVASRRSPVGRMPSMSSRPTTMKQSSNEDGGDTLLLV